MTNKCIKDLAIVGDTAHIKIAEIGTDKIITEFDSPVWSLRVNDATEEIKINPDRSIDEIPKSRTN